MAVTIDATAGGASANSFVTLAEANAYMEGRLNASSWETDATDDDENRALVEATNELTTLNWSGKRTNSTQALAWPRIWAHDPDSPFYDYYDQTVVPQRVKDATMELAFQAIKAGTTDIFTTDSTRGVKRKKIDVIETEYDPLRKPFGLNAYPTVLRYIRPLLASSGIYNTKLIRG